ncbi:hypothetical protein O988_03822 [Pseudogymnoascus sp. VKM F-3808]|nr:hypothetical protein O988_03822 [Pseudogymnoascus sp. VKM F-3808]
MAGHHRTRSHRWSLLVAVDGFSPVSTTGPTPPVQKIPYSCPPLCSFLETSTTQKPTSGIYDFDLTPVITSQTRVD